MSAKTSKSRASRTRTILAIVLAFLLLLLGGVTVFVLSMVRPVGGPDNSSEGGLEWVRSIYGYGKDAANQLSVPYGVGISRDGVIWVPDGVNARVMGFNPDGTFNALIHQGPRGTSPLALGSPNGVAEGPDGRLYITDKSKNAVVIATRDNKILKQINIVKPTSVAVGSGRIVVGAEDGFAILDMNGQLINLVGSRGQADDQFDIVQGVTIAEDGTIFVTDRHNNRVSAYNRDGKRKWIRTMGPASNTGISDRSREDSATTDKNRMILPSGLTVDGAGRVVVIDPFDFQITVLSPKDGKIMAEYGSFGTKDGNFVYPTGIAYDKTRDWFAIADTSNNRIQIVRIPGSGGSVLASLNRSLSGPLKACLIPLAVLVLMIVAAVIARVVRRRRENLRKLQAHAHDGMNVA